MLFQKYEPWLSVPQFGDWDSKEQVPDYSLDFSKIREMRKQNKRDVSRASLGNEEELISPSTSSTKPSKVDPVHDWSQDHSATVSFLALWSSHLTAVITVYFRVKAGYGCLLLQVIKMHSENLMFYFL